LPVALGSSSDEVLDWRSAARFTSRRSRVSQLSGDRPPALPAGDRVSVNSLAIACQSTLWRSAARFTSRRSRVSQLSGARSCPLYQRTIACQSTLWRSAAHR